MEKCATCKFWEEYETGWGGCDMMDSSDGEAENPDTKAVAHDWECYRASVRTRHDFGCVMHQVAEEQPRE